MKNKKTLIILFIAFNIGFCGISFSQDSIARKFHFGIQGNLNLYSERSENTTNSGGNYYNGIYTYSGRTDIYKSFYYKPSFDFFLQFQRWYLSLGVANFSRDQHLIDVNNSGTVVSNVYKYFSIGFGSRLNYLIINPDKYFMAPYFGLGINYIHYKETYPDSKSSKSIEKSHILAGFLGAGIQKNFKKNMFLKLGVSGNFLAKATGNWAKQQADRQGEVAYWEIALGYRFR